MAAAFAALLALAASASAAPLAVVANLNSNAVSLIDTATNRQVGGQIEVGDGPASVAIAPDGRYAYTANVFGDSVSVIDTTTREAVGGPIEVGRGPFGIAISPDGDRAFVTDRGSDEVSAIDTATGGVVGIPVGQVSPSAPTGIAVTPDGKFAYVTIANENAVEVIDTRTMAVVGGPIMVGIRPEGIEFSPDGATAYVVDAGGEEVSAIDTATRKVTPIELSGEGPRGIVVAPDGTRAYVVEPVSHSVVVIDTRADQEIEAIEVGDQPQEVAVSASGKVLFVTVAGGSPGERTAEVERINLGTGARIGSPTKLPGNFAAGIAIAPDQSPTAAFASPSDVIPGTPVTFDGAASSDPDGSIASWKWAFGDGATASGQSAVHTYKAAGSYEAKLGVVDDEGCGEDLVFTGRTAYCSGGASDVTHPVIAKAPVGPGPGPVLLPAGPVLAPSNDFHVGRVVHNRRNGTVRMRVKLPSAGYVLLFGKKVHAVTRKSKGVQAMWLTLHARVELAKRLKKVLRASVRFRITFTPNGGTAKTVHRRVTLVRAPRHKYRRH